MKAVGLAISLVTCFSMQSIHAQAVPNCEALKKIVIAASAIALPTRGAQVMEVQTTSSATTASGSGYCLVKGVILPVDSKAGKINFQLALPDHWNHKAMLLGGGGLDGFIPDVVGAGPAAPSAGPSPLARGYAVFGSDSGHQYPPRGPGFTVARTDGLFFQNAEEYRNYIGEALKKTHDVAIAIIKAAYGSTPAKSYVFGVSGGGRETLTAIGRWPADWDGAVTFFPI